MNNSCANNGQLNTISSTLNTQVPLALAPSSAPVPTATIQHALTLIDTSGVAELIDGWAASDTASTARGSVSSRHVLVASLVLVLEGNRLSSRNVAALLRERLTPTTRNFLDGSDRLAALSHAQLTARVQRATARILETMDGSPLPTRRRRLTKREWDYVMAAREENTTMLEEKRLRFVTFANRLLGAQYDSLPAHLRSDKVNVVIDSRFRSARTRGIGRKQFSALDPDDRVSLEPDAGFHVRHHAPGETVKRAYGWEDELVVLTAADGTAVPNIVIGFNPHRPGEDPARFAGEALEQLAARGHRVLAVVADRAYVAAPAEPLSAPLRSLGAKLIGDYPLNRLGVEAVRGDSILVEGTWYARSMPLALVEAVKNARLESPSSAADRQAVQAGLAKRIAAREPYALRPKADSSPSVHEQAHPYRSPEWDRAYTAGRNALERFASIHREAHATRPDGGQLRGATAQAFLSLLAIVGTNARIIDAFLVRHPVERKSNVTDRVALRCPAVVAAVGECKSSPARALRSRRSSPSQRLTATGRANRRTAARESSCC